MSANSGADGGFVAGVSGGGGGGGGAGAAFARGLVRGLGSPADGTDIKTQLDAAAALVRPRNVSRGGLAQAGGLHDSHGPAVAEEGSVW
jgi:hypothetical protein